MSQTTYDNGCPKVAWCINCERPVAQMATGDSVPHSMEETNEFTNQANDVLGAFLDNLETA